MADKSIQMQDPKTGENVYPITITDNIYLPNGTPLMKYLNSIPLPLGSLIHSTTPLNNAGLHLADGGELMFGGVYDDFCKHMKGIYDRAELGYSDNVTPVGSVAYSNNSYSNFNATNYLEGYTVNDTSNWEIVLKIKTGVVSGTSYNQIIYTGGYDANIRQIMVGITTAGKFVLYLGSGGSSWDIANAVVGSYSVVANKEYLIKIAFNGSNYRLSYSTNNGGMYTNDILITSTTKIAGYQMYFGTYVNSTNDYGFKGTLYLNGSYLNINNKRYWNGTIPIQFADEVTYQAELATYGQCGKYIITDTYVKLPTITKLTGGLVNTEMTKIASMNEAGLPNITDKLSTRAVNYNLHSWLISSEKGMFYNNGEFSSVYTDSKPTSNSGAGKYINFDASKSNPIYGKSATVETEYVKFPYYIVVATVTKTDIEVNIDNVVTELNNINSTLTKVTNQPVLLFSSTGATSGSVPLSQSIRNFKTLVFEMDTTNGYLIQNTYVVTPTLTTFTYFGVYGYSTSYINMQFVSDTQMTIVGVSGYRLRNIYGVN